MPTYKCTMCRYLSTLSTYSSHVSRGTYLCKGRVATHVICSVDPSRMTFEVALRIYDPSRVRSRFVSRNKLAVKRRACVVSPDTMLDLQV